MVTKAIYVALIISATAPTFCWAETGKEQYLELGELCAGAQLPGVCMASYGFKCHQSRRPDTSIEAYVLGCNLDLGDGRYYFVQMLYDNGGWNVELEETYRPEYSQTETPVEDAALALSYYIRHAMQGYSMHSSGAGYARIDKAQYYEIGTRRDDGRIAVRAMCGVIYDVPLDEAVSMQVKSDCEGHLLRTVKYLGQQRKISPYRVAGPSEFEWESRFARLVSGHTALVWKGRYTFAEEHTPCRWMSDCCSATGSVYLDSCRVPTEGELRTIETCLAEEETHYSEEFFDCLRTAGVKVGCEEQSDGTRVCY